MAMDFLKYICEDSVVFVILHIGLLASFFYAVLAERKMNHDMPKVKRGTESWNHFYLAYGILSVIVTQIISISEFGKGYKVSITVIDLAILLYLAFFNNWFRNKTIGIIVASQSREE
jgi:dipeptide/tripeptide permease